MRLLSYLILPVVLTLTAVAFAQNRIEVKSRVTLKVGEKAVIHAFRGECGKLPTEIENWGETTDLGITYLGKEGVRGSRSCGGDTPAYEVIFEAEEKGRETIRLFGDRIRIRVR